MGYSIPILIQFEEEFDAEEEDLYSEFIIAIYSK